MSVDMGDLDAQPAIHVDLSGQLYANRRGVGGDDTMRAGLPLTDDEEHHIPGTLRGPEIVAAWRVAGLVPVRTGRGSRIHWGGLTHTLCGYRRGGWYVGYSSISVMPLCSRCRDRLIFITALVCDTPMEALPDANGQAQGIIDRPWDAQHSQWDAALGVRSLWPPVGAPNAGAVRGTRGASPVPRAARVAA